MFALEALPSNHLNHPATQCKKNHHDLTVLNLLAMERCADPSTQLEVDEGILDYLVYTAIKVLLEDNKSCRHGHDEAEAHVPPDLPFQMVDCRLQDAQTARIFEAYRPVAFLAMFRSMHPDRQGPEELQFRLRLLKFTALYTNRSTPSNISPPRFALELMVPQHQEHVNSFRKGDTIKGELGPLSPIEASATPAADNFTTADTSESIPSFSLLDTLPSFMALSAAHISPQVPNITEIWMRLAAGYMAHAVAEQYLTYNSQRPESQVLHEAFAYWGDPDLDVQEGSDEWAINAMFFNEDNVVVAEWEDIRQEHMRALEPGPGISLRQHLKALVAHELPLPIFEDTVVSFLEGLLLAYPKPYLAQLEASEVDGLSEEALALRRDLGLGGD